MHIFVVSTEIVSYIDVGIPSDNGASRHISVTQSRDAGRETRFLLIETVGTNHFEQLNSVERCDESIMSILVDSHSITLHQNKAERK